MPIQAQSADGVIHEFPDGTDNTVIDKAMKTYATQQPMSWGQVAGQALTNLGPSAKKFASDVVSPVTHPIETGKGMLGLARGVGDYARDVPGLRTALSISAPAVGAALDVSDAAARGKGDKQDLRASVRAVGQVYKDRYGGMENIKRTIATDPVGAAADASMLFGGGEATLPGRLGRVAGMAERVTNPLTAPLAAAKGLGMAVSPSAARIGAEGGAGAEAFRGQMRGSAPQPEVVNDARAAVQAMRKQRGQMYLTEKAKFIADPTVLDFSEIDNAIGNAQRIKTYKGQQLDPAVEMAWFNIKGMVDDWRSLSAADFHTVEGLDALKQKIGNVRDAAPLGSPERTAANEIYGAVRQTIINQAPEYAKVMKGYEEASKQIRQIELQLTGKQDANVETALRKLQSTLRTQVSPIYKNRKVLAEFLANAGAPTLMEKIAGQRYASWRPTTLGKEATLGELGLALGSIIFGHPGGAAVLAAAPFASPRVRGELGYGLGAASRAAKYRKSFRGAVGSSEVGKQQYGGPQEN